MRCLNQKVPISRLGFVVKIIFILFLLSCNRFPGKENLNKSFQPGKIWLDSDSIPINAHGGGILFFEGKYYWFGEYKTAGRKGNTAQIGISCYSSVDLFNWKNEGIALKVSNDPNSEISQGCVMERPKVIFNEKTHKFVMWFHLELKGQEYQAARTAVGQSNTITGPYSYITSYRANARTWPINFPDSLKNITIENTLKWWTPEWEEAVKNGLFVRRDFDKGQMSRDMTLFVDDDGKAYHIHASEENLTLHISELTPDYLGFSGKWTRVFPLGHSEAPAVFKRNGKYYMITSGCTGWDPNAARSAVASSIWGPWKPLGNPCVGKDAELTFYSQSTYVLPIHGSDTNFIFMGDRWKPENPIDGRYVWLPVSFEEDKPIIRWKENWDLTVF